MLLKCEFVVSEVSTNGLAHNYINLYQLYSDGKDTATYKAAKGCLRALSFLNGGKINFNIKAAATIFLNIYPSHFNADTVYTGNQKHKHYLHEYEAILLLK